MSWSPAFDQRVRVRALDGCGAARMFMYCEKRPEPCHVHEVRHGGHVQLRGHLAEEAGLVGEIAAHMGGENGGHPWIVRYDENQAVTWHDGQTLVVNGGMYAADELEPWPDLGLIRIVGADDLPPLGFIGTMPRVERFDPPTMEDRPWPDRDYTRPRGKPAGGLWTSPLLANKLPMWGGHRMARQASWWWVEPEPDARIAVIDGADDVEALLAAFPYRDGVVSWVAESLGHDGREIDFAALAQHVDAVWMTGQAREDILYLGAVDLVHYTTWDIESVLWLRWKLARASRIPKVNVRRRIGG